MAVEVQANPYSWWVWPLLSIMKTACKEQSKAVIDVYFVIRVILKAVL